MATGTTHDTTVRKTITVKASVERAFDVFTAGFDTWWPRSHHIGKKPLQQAIIEPRIGGRCLGREADGTECQWGTVVAWEPPHRLVIAWQIDPTWQFEPDLSRASEVEVLFTPEAAGLTHVALAHRHLERHGAEFEKVRAGVGGPGGWGGLLQTFGRRANVYHPAVTTAAFILSSNDAIADRVFQGVKAEDVWKRPTAQTNALLWVFAHMAAVRGRLLNALGDEFDPHLDAFGRGAAVQDPSAYPTREEIQQASREVNVRLFRRLADLTEADMARPVHGPLPPAVRTLGEQIAFIALHDSYHVGQLGYVRKALGYPGVVG